MFKAALFTIAKIWAQSKFLSKHEWIKKIWCINISNVILSMEKNEILPSATIWMLSEIFFKKEIISSLMCGI